MHNGRCIYSVMGGRKPLAGAPPPVKLVGREIKMFGFYKCFFVFLVHHQLLLDVCVNVEICINEYQRAHQLDGTDCNINCTKCYKGDLPRHFSVFDYRKSKGDSLCEETA